MKMTATGVKYKLKNLEKNKVIVAYKLLLDTSKLGYTYYKIDLDLEDMSIIPSLHQFILQHPNILYRDVAVGGSDFEFDGEFPSQEAFYIFMDELKAQFPRKIRSYWYYKALKIYHFSYFPEEF
jgi:DNA-binding Lrp family transcriptional regulator